MESKPRIGALSGIVRNVMRYSYYMMDDYVVFYGLTSPSADDPVFYLVHKSNVHEFIHPPYLTPIPVTMENLLRLGGYEEALWEYIRPCVTDHTHRMHITSFTEYFIDVEF